MDADSLLQLFPSPYVPVQIGKPLLGEIRELETKWCGKKASKVDKKIRIVQFLKDILYTY